MYLLDSHALLWWLMAPKKLTRREYAMIEQPEGHVFISAGSIWEIAIKTALNKLEVPNNFEAEIERNEFVVLPINFSIAWRVHNLPSHHNDPFDRVIVATALEHDLTLISHDPIFRHYGIKLFA